MLIWGRDKSGGVKEHPTKRETRVVTIRFSCLLWHSARVSSWFCWCTRTSGAELPTARAPHAHAELPVTPAAPWLCVCRAPELVANPQQVCEKCDVYSMVRLGDLGACQVERPAWCVEVHVRRTKHHILGAWEVE